jgi:hypothetical protein
MPFYTPSPMVNFNYEPAKSDARRILDTQKEIKQEQQKDQEFEQKMLLNQQAYEMGKIQMQKAQIEADQLIKQKRLDEGAGQVYNSVIASGGTKGDGYKAVLDYYLREGGWAAGQKAKEEAAAAWKEAWEMADVNPAAAEEAAEIANSMAPPGSPRMTAQSIMEAKKRLKAENQKPIVGEDGDVLFMQPDGTWKVQNFLSDFSKVQIAEKNALARTKLEQEAKESQQRLALGWAKLAEEKAARKQRTEEKKEAMSFQEKEVLKSQKQLVTEIRKEVERAKQKLASPDSNDRMAMIAALTGNSDIANLGNDEANKKLLRELIARKEEQLMAGIEALADIPGGKEIADNMRQTLQVTAPAAGAGSAVETPKKSIKDYSFMKKKGATREYPR